MAEHELNAEWLFDQTAYSEFVDSGDRDHAIGLLDSALDQVGPDNKLEDIDEFWEYLDFLGIEYEDFNWEDFREWYES